ncbi:MAG TPA: amino acid--tRNA ligase-related protein, partial [Nevskiaceae bacterium]|nr:amino acid--tRNA ligase-related protein [Nevskiaceae bacterium]
EQRRRFEADLATRAAHGQRCPPPDERLLAALAYGLPECSGVALGLDRLLMLLLRLPRVAEAQSFDGELV